MRWLCIRWPASMVSYNLSWHWDTKPTVPSYIPNNIPHNPHGLIWPWGHFLVELPMFKGSPGGDSRSRSCSTASTIARLKSCIAASKLAKVFFNDTLNSSSSVIASSKSVSCFLKLLSDAWSHREPWNLLAQRFLILKYAVDASASWSCRDKVDSSTSSLNHPFCSSLLFMCSSISSIVCSSRWGWDIVFGMKWSWYGLIGRYLMVSGWEMLWEHFKCWRAYSCSEIFKESLDFILELEVVCLWKWCRNLDAKIEGGGS